MAGGGEASEAGRNQGVRGDVRAATDGDTYVHGASAGEGPRSTQFARSGVGGPRADGAGGERRMVPKERPRSYYGRPVVKPPVWKPEIPWYLFTGGLGGASSALAFVASRSGNRRLARRSWALALLGISASPVLLILDLGRPERFINMLRVFKVTSPMNVGSWLVLANGVAVTPAAAASLLGFPKRLGRRAEPVAAVLGLPLTTYTAVLFSNSAIPVWSEARRELPALFAAGAAASAGAAAAAVTPARAAAPARRLAIGASIAEIAVGVAMEKRLGDLAMPYHEGEAGAYERAARVLTGVGAVLMVAAGRRRRTAIAAGALILAGAVCKRWATFKAGFQSAEDPNYTVGPQRERIERGQPIGPA
jgi:formate-dependent nitrite reductase membrane component NrfD